MKRLKACELRLVLLASIILAAILSPGVSVRAGWPEVRLEQVLALAAGVWLAAGWWRGGRGFRPRLGFVDWLLLGVGASTLASLLWAPLVLAAEASVRDSFEVLKVALYWLLFRVGWETARRDRRAVPTARSCLLVGGALSATFGLVQYYDLFDVNAWATPVWAPAHHLRTLAEDGRVPGTVGNPNYFGMLSVLVLLAGTASTGVRAVWLRLVMLAVPALGLVISGSRGALLAWGAGMAVLWVAALARRARVRQMAVATVGALVALALAVLVVEMAPRGRESYLTRIARSAGDEGDGSLALRLERWRSVALPWVEADTGSPDTASGTPRNLLENGDLERGGERPDGFRTLPGTRATLTDSEALFGARAVRFRGNAAEGYTRTALFQQRYLGRAGGAPLTASMSVKLIGPMKGELWLWTNVYYADGTRSDPLSRVAVDPAQRDVWQTLTALIEPETGKSVTFVGVYLLGEGFEGEALVDGFALVEGRASPAFALLREAPAGASGSDRDARLRESPLLGVGPGKAAAGGAVDNEYLEIAGRYGLVGLGLYLALWLATLASAWQASFRNADLTATALRLTIAAGVAALLVFNLVAGSFLHLQLMALFWTLAGVALATESAHGSPSEPSSNTTCEAKTARNVSPKVHL